MQNLRIQTIAELLGLEKEAFGERVQNTPAWDAAPFGNSRNRRGQMGPAVHPTGQRGQQQPAQQQPAQQQPAQQQPAQQQPAQQQPAQQQPAQQQPDEEFGAGVFDSQQQQQQQPRPSPASVANPGAAGTQMNLFDQPNAQPVVDNRGNEWDFGESPQLDTESVGGESFTGQQITPQEAPAGFQVPGFADPQMGQQMQRMYDENQRNTEFDEWAKNSGFSKQQLSQLRSGLNPQQQQQQQQQQPGDFWGDVGRGAAGGAAIGGIGGAAAGGGIGAVPGAAVGGIAGGIAGGAKNLWNSGKNMWNQFQDFRNQPQQQYQQQPQQYQQQQYQPRRAASVIKVKSEKQVVVAFLKTLNSDYDRIVFLEYVRAGMNSLERSRVLTASMSSASNLVSSRFLQI